MKIVKYILIVALVALVIIQFMQPDRNEKGYETVAHFEKNANVSTEVATIMKTNCYDCHSDQTQYPWYANVAPVSFWLNDHVEHGKGHFNVSAWESYSAKKKDHKLEELIEFVEEGEMPLDSYTWLHGDLSPEETKALLDWAKMARVQYQKEMGSIQ